jgi:hypothetical protein
VKDALLLPLPQLHLQTLSFFFRTPFFHQRYYNMCKEGCSLGVLEQKITQLEGKSNASISQFKQIGDRFDKLGLLDRLQDLADSLPNETHYIYPFKTNFILTEIMPNAKTELNAIACLDYDERMTLQRKKQVDKWKEKFDNAITEVERKGIEKPKKGKSIGDIILALKAMTQRVAAVQSSLKLCDSREKQAMKLLQDKAGDEGVVPKEKNIFVREQTRELKEEFLNSFKGGEFDNVIPEALKEILKNKIPLSEALVAEKADEESDSISESENDGEESPSKRILFEDGNSLTDFIRKFAVFSPGQKLLQAAKHRHDAKWDSTDWKKMLFQLRSQW